MDLHNWNTAVTLTWNLFDGFGTGARVASLRSQQTQNEWEESEYESTLEILLRNAAADWQAALNAIEEAILAPRRGRRGRAGRRRRGSMRAPPPRSSSGGRPRPAARWNWKRRGTPATPWRRSPN